MSVKREIVLSTNNFGKKDFINARNGFSLQDCEANAVLHIVKAAIILGPDNEAEDDTRQVAILMDGEGVTYTSISETVLDSMSDVCELIDEEGAQDIKLFKRKSKGGRDFLTLSIL